MKHNGKQTLIFKALKEHVDKVSGWSYAETRNLEDFVSNSLLSVKSKIIY